MKISDELRELCDIGACQDQLCALADRINAEMVELPKDADGVPIHVGDTVYTTFMSKANVARISILMDSFLIMCEHPKGETAFHNPRALTHTRPDSLERIAEELEAARGWRDQNGEYSCIVSSVSTKTLQEWARRIRKLAKEGEHED